VALFCTAEQGIIGPVSTSNQDAAPPVYADRSTGQVFPDATAMVNAYLARFSERAGQPMQPLDENGYTQTRKGSASIGLNVLDDHGLLLLLAPVMPVPASGREAFYRRLLELSFLTTADAAFAIDAAKDEVFVRALRRLSGLDYEEFEDLLDTVGRVADEWDDALKREFGKG
jgi:Tir chaperone family protein CesT